MAEEAVFKYKYKQMGIFNKIKIFLQEALLEVKKVNWPTRQETIRYTLIVIGISVGVAVLLGGFDFIFVNALNCLFPSSFGGTCFGGIFSR